MIQVHFSVCFLTALLLLILPLDWFAGIVVAAVFHELSHILVLYALGGNISKISVQSGGCVIETAPIGEWGQFFSILAGPVASALLLLFCRTAPKIAICGLIQCLSNLIPVLPLDGGRLLRLLLYRFCPDKAETVMEYVDIGICSLFLLSAIWLFCAASAGLWPLLLAVIWSGRVFIRKIPCKPSQIGVQ